jgi:hypothetical protein
MNDSILSERHRPIHEYPFITAQMGSRFNSHTTSSLLHSGPCRPSSKWITHRPISQYRILQTILSARAVRILPHAEIVDGSDPRAFPGDALHAGGVIQRGVEGSAALANKPLANGKRAGNLACVVSIIAIVLLAQSLLTRGLTFLLVFFFLAVERPKEVWHVLPLILLAAEDDLFFSIDHFHANHRCPNDIAFACSTLTPNIDQTLWPA